MSGQKERLMAWASERTGINYTSGNAIGVEEDGNLLAVVVFNGWQEPTISAHIASDGSRRWACRQFIRAMFDYPFRQLGCTRITAPIDERNHAARRFVEKLGFVIEGRLRRAVKDGSDRLIYGLLKEDCKWL